jgi:hypothetical protein
MRLYLVIHSDHEGGNVSAHTSHLVGRSVPPLSPSLTPSITPPPLPHFGWMPCLIPSPGPQRALGLLPFAFGGDERPRRAPPRCEKGKSGMGGGGASSTFGSVWSAPHVAPAS